MARKKQQNQEMPSIMRIVDTWDEPWRSYGKNILYILCLAIIAMVAIYVIQAMASIFTGQPMSQSAYSISAIGGMAVAAIGAIVVIAKGAFKK